MVTQAVILVGGQGTRLRPLTSQLPKPVLDVVDRPFLAHMLDWLAGHGITEAVLCCGFKADVLKEHLGEGVVHGISLTYLTEPEPRGTAGALKFAEDHLHERFVMLNGDVLTDLDLSAQIAAHESTGASGTLGLVPVLDPSAFGLVRLQDDNVVRGFVEKPKPEEIDTDLISAGAYVLERSVVDLIAPDISVSIEREVFPKLIGEGLYGFPHRGAYFMDLGTPERYLDGLRDVLTGALTTQTYGLLGNGGVRVPDGVALGEGSTISSPTWIGDGVTIGQGVRIGPNTVIGDGATIADGAAVRDSVVLSGAKIGARSELYRSLVGHGATVGDDVVVGHLAVVGPGAVVEAGAIIPHETKIEHELEASDVSPH
ncbi:MAG: NDP-sugar synthase [Solirubrobacteraceae bacterium]|nr:NDP-sugar synthase [Solirubrobacteraceae bacterium]